MAGDSADRINKLKNRLIKQFVSQLEKVSDLVIRSPWGPPLPKKEILKAIRELIRLLKKAERKNIRSKKKTTRAKRSRSRAKPAS